MWIALLTLIQEAFQHHLNATVSTAGHQGYAPAQPYQQNAFGILGNDKSNDEESIAKMVDTQVAALTYQSQLMQSTAANTSQRQDMQMAQLMANQDAQHATIHQLIDGMNAMAFNMSDAGPGRFAGCGYGGRSHGGCSRMQGCNRGHPAYISGYPQGGGIPQGGFPPTMFCPMCAQRCSGGFSWHHCWRYSPILAPAALVINGGYGPPSGGYGIPRGPPAQANVQQQPYSNVVKRYSNWNACYLCGFDVANGHTSMLRPPHLYKASHQIRFNRQNAQHYINLGHPCSTRNRHNTQFPAPMQRLGAANRNLAFKYVNPVCVITTNSPYPTQLCMSATTFDLDNDDITVHRMFHCSQHHHTNHACLITSLQRTLLV
jgi:hypothetical protein